MARSSDKNSGAQRKKRVYVWGTILIAALLIVLAGTLYAGNFFPHKYTQIVSDAIEKVQMKPVEQAPPPLPPIDKTDYDRRMIKIANYASSTPTTTPRIWPVKSLVYPLPGAILPFKRVVSYYGNFYSKGMGVLGEYEPDTMLQKLQAEVKKWEDADPGTPVVPGIHYIVETAQGYAGKDGKYRLRMPDDQIDKALELAAKVNGIVFLDFQVGLSNVQADLPVYEKYLKMPQVNVGIDPEFSMKTGAKPGTVIGTMDASDVNWTANYLAGLVKANNLPPKILVVHRFTQAMLTNYKNIKLIPEVQFVIDMDGWGSPGKKMGTYRYFVAAEPVQFTGFKLFYKNDLKQEPPRMLTPKEVLSQTPQPMYIQYQ